jgi:hypothetical protein
VGASGRRKGQGVWLWIRGGIIIRGLVICRWILRGSIHWWLLGM